MPNNKGFTMELKKNGNGYISLFPKTVQSQVIGWNIGEIFGPYTLVLKADAWINNKQIVNFDGISNQDFVYCLKVLSGTKEEMIAQDINYSKLSEDEGVESLNGGLQFKCKTKPTADIQMQIWWTR